MSTQKPQVNTSKEGPRDKQGVFGTFFDAITRLFRGKSPAESEVKETIDHTIRLELSENRTLNMSHAEVVRKGEVILVNGTITKKPGRLIPMGAHLHVVPMNKKGNALLNDVVRCELSQLKRKDIKSIRFMAQFPTPLESIDFVKIVYHDHSHSQCSQWGCRKRT